MSGEGHAGGHRPGTRAFVGLGSNLGDRLAELRAGLAALASHPRIETLAVSGVYESDYVGPGGPQAAYLNACACLLTELRPQALLAALKLIERGRGRTGETHMRPRALDLDILLYGDLVWREPDLTIPHARLIERAFVLEPLAELDAALILPDSGQTVGRLCAMIRAAHGRTAHRRPELLLSTVAAVD
ncbi:2-amino-4-hydroxy-6-hydroxymethyldihydropteridine diphosphokinase [bacterium]|nr:2-amino-4-hydroxy-6-hydroxymethyldihydropteridine diphosphokinase [bacterium]MBU1073017.1 2-amino-4-hydroxy-6-hydroxymethyldihydropteridine diphosphokinase [bacterium]MBU1676871.1 2-amino-4-hydroxy-6-hydroxymethyldihydropteridine diphosphokinase [bacterium]